MTENVVLNPIDCAMLIKIIVIIAFLIIISSLGYALYHLIKGTDQAESEKIFKSLATRISLSLLLFIFIFIAFAIGLFEPQGIGARIQHFRDQQHEQQAPTP